MEKSNLDPLLRVIWDELPTFGRPCAISKYQPCQHQTLVQCTGGRSVGYKVPCTARLSVHVKSCTQTAVSEGDKCPKVSKLATKGGRYN